MEEPATTCGAPRRRGAKKVSPPVDTSTSSAAMPCSNTSDHAPQRQGAATSPADLTETCWELADLQKIRRFCIVSQSRSDRAMESAIAHCLGYDPNASEAERKALFKRAAEIIKAVEKGKDPKLPPPGDPRRRAIDSFLPMIPITAMSRAVWDKKRDEIETNMRKLAASLPVLAWVKQHAKGVGDLGLARIVGEAPLIGQYQTHEKLWKRLGVAVVAGERQQKKRDRDEAKLHGYAPRRRAECWSVCSDTMFRAQWRGADDDDPDAIGKPIGPYGAVYWRRKQETLARIEATGNLPFDDPKKWTKKRCDADARRVMAKEFLRDLWNVWHDRKARHPARFAQPK
jgi:hypothetical protein